MSSSMGKILILVLVKIYYFTAYCLKVQCVKVLDLFSIHLGKTARRNTSDFSGPEISLTPYNASKDDRHLLSDMDSKIMLA